MFRIFREITSARPIFRASSLAGAVKSCAQHTTASKNKAGRITVLV
jgi:hypothetical protein